MNASLKPPAGAFPNLAAHHERMLKRPAVVRTIADEAALGYELTAPPNEVTAPPATP